MTEQATVILAAFALLSAGGSAGYAGISAPEPRGPHGEAGGQAQRPAGSPKMPREAGGTAHRGAAGAQRTISTDARESSVHTAISRAVAAFNDTGAGVYLTFTRNGGDIQLTTTNEFRGEKAGESTVDCELPCRPKGARIVIERVLDEDALDQVVVHEVGHSLGLAHDNGGCAAMNDHVRHDDPCRSRLARAPLQARDSAALRAIWGPAATSKEGGR